MIGFWLLRCVFGSFVIRMVFGCFLISLGIGRLELISVCSVCILLLCCVGFDRCFFMSCLLLWMIDCI